jgi:hypothetical protein
MGGYRSYSNESAAPAAGRNSPPQNAPMSRTTSMTYAPQSQAQPAHGYNSYRSPPASYASPSTRPSPYAHPSYYNGHPHYPSAAAPTSVDMPRSISYPNYNQSYPSYMPHQQGYPSHLPPLMRHTSTSTIGEGMNGMDINRSNMGYSFANRLPLVDRPFKCDECVQSFVSTPLNLRMWSELTCRTVITISSDTSESI